MSMSNTLENAIALLIFNNTNAANIGDATGLRGSSTAGSFWIALYTADPGETGTATTNETAYTSYARVAVARSGSGWTVTANSVSPAANIDFPECTGSPGSAITHFGIVSSSAGAGDLFFYGALSSSITMATGVIPRIKTTSTITFS